MPEFDFVTDPAFRTSLESDYREMRACQEKGCWKAVLVLAGSIIEAVLVDHVSSLPSPPSNIGEMTLGPLLKHCKEKKLISERCHDIGVAVKNYRNLVHPGKLVRQKEVVDAQGASVAVALAEMVVKEVESQKKETYGFTAAQLFTKALSDSSAVNIFKHLLKGIHDSEFRQFLLETIPNDPRWFSGKGFSESECSNLCVCFHHAFEKAPLLVRQEVVNRYLHIVRTADKQTVTLYERRFFRTTQMDLMNPDQLAIAKRRLFTDFQESPEMLIGSFMGIHRFITEHDLDDVLAVLFSVLAGKIPVENVAHCIQNELIQMPDNLIAILHKAFASARKTGNPLVAAAIQPLEEYLSQIAGLRLMRPLLSNVLKVGP